MYIELGSAKTAGALSFYFGMHVSTKQLFTLLLEQTSVGRVQRASQLAHHSCYRGLSTPTKKAAHVGGLLYLKRGDGLE
jgi:hypothetical protein